MASREERAKAARAKHASEACRTYAIALLGGGVAEPFITSTAFEIENYAAIIVGLTLQFLGLYLAGKGEP